MVLTDILERTDNAGVESRHPAGMRWIEGGGFVMGSDHHYIEERPAHPVRVDGFWIDIAPVTNRQFMAFVAATSYVTVAEKAPRAQDYPGALPAMLRAGSMVFIPPKTLDGQDPAQWWKFKFGASWRRPYAGLSDLRGKLDHPVVHIAYADALAYAAWADRELPTEAEWEFAARGGHDGDFAWPDNLGLTSMANVWEGSFPIYSTKPSGNDRTSPVGSFPPNGFGLHDMIGNVWEWTTDYWSSAHGEPAQRSCCVPQNPRGGAIESSYDPRQPEIRIARRVVKGGSHLCAPNYCRRYRPAARHAQAEDTSMSHVGFRCIRRARDL